MTRKQFESARERVLTALEKPNSRWKFRDLARIAGGKDQANEVIAQLRKEGRQIIYGKADHRFYLARIPTPYSNYYDMTWLPTEGKQGWISDSHLCSDAERLDLLNECYDEFARQGISVVLHCGDLTDGNGGIYPGHLQHIKVVGVQNQAIYVIKNYPQREGIKTYFISGNHDIKAFEKEGVDVCSLVVNGLDHNGRHYEGRQDLVYLGQYSRTLLWPQNITVQMLHPRSGAVYARSYPQQRRSREMNSETRPDIQISGHTHTFCWILDDITQFVSLPAFQDETEFFVRMGFSRQMGWCVADYRLKEGKVDALKVELFRRSS